MTAAVATPRAPWRPSRADRHAGSGPRRVAVGARRRGGSSRRCAAASPSAATAASTFEHVAREAGVSRGLLHYYFGTKEQLLVEAVRRDCELRMELLERQLAGAQTADDFIALMAQNLQETVREDPDFVTLVFELFTLSRRNEEIAVEYAELMRRTREQVAGMLASAQREGVAAAARRAGDGRRDPVLARRRVRAADARRARARLHRDGAARASPARARCWPTEARARRLIIIGRGCQSTSTGVPTGARSRSCSPSAMRR